MAHLDNVNQKLADVDVDAVITIKDATAVQSISQMLTDTAKQAKSLQLHKC